MTISPENAKDYLELLPLICNQATCFLRRIEKEEIKTTGHEGDPRLVFFSSVLTSAIPSISRLDSV